jgi:hypothetical protein
MPALLSRSAAFAAGALFTAALLRLGPQPAPSPTQTGRVPLVENADVRVWRSLILPNTALAMHRHDHARVIVPLQGGTMNFVHPDGSKDVDTWQPGQAYYYPAMPPGTLHADVNPGPKPIEVIAIELLRDK